MDIRELRYAVTALEEGGFAPAAERLYVSRQALSQAVRRLEQEIGFSLFTVRDNNHLHPTAVGAAFLTEARSVVAAFDALAERYGAEGFAASQPRELSVVLGTGVSISLPGNLLPGFRASYPSVHLELDETSNDRVLELVDDGHAEVALLGTCPDFVDRYDYELVIPTGLWLAVPRDNPLSTRERLTLADLDGQTVITTGKHNHLHRYFTQACGEAGVRPVIPISTANADMLVQLALEYRGMFFAFPEIMPASVDASMIAVLPLDIPEAPLFGTYLVRKNGARHSAAARSFWEYVRSATRPIRERLGRATA